MKAVPVGLASLKKFSFSPSFSVLFLFLRVGLFLSQQELHHEAHTDSAMSLAFRRVTAGLRGGAKRVAGIAELAAWLLLVNGAPGRGRFCPSILFFLVLFFFFFFLRKDEISAVYGAGTGGDQVVQGAPQGNGADRGGQGARCGEGQGAPPTGGRF
jgi:hypothetical protein